MVRRRLLICRNDYWPMLTPDRLWEIPYEDWASLALAVDKIAEQKEQEAAAARALRK